MISFPIKSYSYCKNKSEWHSWVSNTQIHWFLLQKGKRTRLIPSKINGHVTSTALYQLNTTEDREMGVLNWATKDPIYPCLPEQDININNTQLRQQRNMQCKQFYLYLILRDWFQKEHQTSLTTKDLAKRHLKSW